MIKVLLAGICNTDIELIRGYCPFQGVLGHEFVGLVEDGPSQLLGRRVVGEINATCGYCECCLNGLDSHCTNRTVLGIDGRDGAFAEYLVLPSENLHVVPDSMDSSVAVFTEPLAAALEIQEQISVGQGDRVLVVGDGKLGQLIAQSLAYTGCDLSVIGKRANKLAILRDHGIVALTASEIGSGNFDIAVECTGSPSGFDLARDALRPRGTLVLKSTYAGYLELETAAIVVDELTLLGSRCGPFAPAIELLNSGAIDVESLIDDCIPLDRGVSALERASQPGVLKILLDVANS